MTNSTQVSGQGKKSRRGRALRIAAIVAVVLCATLLVNSVFRTQQAKSRVNQAFQQGLVHANTDMEAKVEYLTDIGLIGRPMAEARGDVCSVGHSDAGWMVQSYYQDCYLVTVRGFAKQELYREALPRAEGWGYSGQECELMEKGYGYETVVSHCFPPDPLDTSHAVAYAADGASTRLLSRTGDWTKPSGSVIWVTNYTTYLHENLGCSKTSVLFCNSPRSEPIVAD